MENTCELAGNIWSQVAKYRTCSYYLGDKRCERCTWCNIHVCHHHAHHTYDTIACDKCMVLDKTIVLNGEIRRARGGKNPNETSEYFTQYSGMHTKSATAK